MRVLVTAAASKLHVESDGTVSDTIALLEIAKAVLVRENIFAVHAVSSPTSTSAQAQAPAIARRVDAP